MVTERRNFATAGQNSCCSPAAGLRLPSMADITGGQTEVQGGWKTVRTTGSAYEFHHHTPEGPYTPTIWAHDVTAPALVLGSTQHATDIDEEAISASGWEICRRRSGGGLVVLEPGNAVWIDVFVPPSHPAWENDIGRASWWIGHLWAATFHALDPAVDATVHEGPLLRPEEGRLYCFAGLGPGEVTVDHQKVVGVSQRRTRSGARFQTVCVLGQDSASANELLPHLSPAVQLVIEQSRPVGWPKQRQKPTTDEVVDAFNQAAQAIRWVK